MKAFRGPDPRTTRAALAAVLSFIVMRLASRLGLDLPPEVRDGIVFIIICYGLHVSSDSKSTHRHHGPVDRKPDNKP